MVVDTASSLSLSLSLCMYVCVSSTSCVCVSFRAGTTSNTIMKIVFVIIVLPLLLTLPEVLSQLQITDKQCQAFMTNDFCPADQLRAYIMCVMYLYYDCVYIYITINVHVPYFTAEAPTCFDSYNQPRLGGGQLFEHAALNPGSTHLSQLAPCCPVAV